VRDWKRLAGYGGFQLASVRILNLQYLIHHQPSYAAFQVGKQTGSVGIHRRALAARSALAQIQYGYDPLARLGQPIETDMVTGQGSQTYIAFDAMDALQGEGTDFLANAHGKKLPRQFDSTGILGGK
jgi:hypothetical protein